jgi:hypothetical protein
MLPTIVNGYHIFTYVLIIVTDFDFNRMRIPIEFGEKRPEFIRLGQQINGQTPLTTSRMICLQQLVALHIERQLLRPIDSPLKLPSKHYLPDHHLQPANFSLVDFAKKIQYSDSAKFAELRIDPAIGGEGTSNDLATLDLVGTGQGGVEEVTAVRQTDPR